MEPGGFSPRGPLSDRRLEAGASAAPARQKSHASPTPESPFPNPDSDQPPNSPSPPTLCLRRRQPSVAGGSLHGYQPASVAGGRNWRLPLNSRIPALARLPGFAAVPASHPTKISVQKRLRGAGAAGRIRAIRSSLVPGRDRSACRNRQKRMATYWMLDAWDSDLKITTDLSSQELVDLPVPRNRGRLSGDGIHVHGVIGALTQQAASL